MKMFAAASEAKKDAEFQHASCYAIRHNILYMHNVKWNERDR
jgi:hypothetical protein